MVPHSFYFGPGLAATLHVAASTPGVPWVEWPRASSRRRSWRRPSGPSDGWLAPPPGPGLGVRPNPEALRRHPLGAAGLPLFTTV